MLVPIVKRVAPIEQRALLGGPTTWRWGTASMLVIAGLLSLSVKAWSSAEIGVLAVGLAGTLAVWRFALAGPSGSSSTDKPDPGRPAVALSDRASGYDGSS